MIITSNYILILILAVFLTLFAWGLDAPSMASRVGPGGFKRIRNLAALLLVILIVWLCVINFPVTLTALVVGTGLISLIDLCFFRRKRLILKREQPLIVENARSFFVVLLLVWIVRSFIIQPYRVPTGSLQPTVQPGDFLVVNQYAYGLRFPVGNREFLPVGKPKRGEIALFYFPPNPSLVFVKRVIGVPGDRVEYRDKVLYVNGKEMKQIALDSTVDDEPAVGGNPEQHIPVEVKEEDLDGVKHRIFINQGMGLGDDFDVTVPPGHYFMMGDNRDNSDDSRMWGFVPDANLIGKAFGIWMSWDAIHHRIRWDRIGMAVK